MGVGPDVAVASWSDGWGYAVLGSCVLFLGWVLASGVSRTEPALSQASRRPRRLRPWTASALGPLQRRPVEPEPGVVALEAVQAGPNWSDHRAWVRTGDGPARAYAVGERLPDQSVLAGVSPEGIVRFTESDVLESVRLNGSVKVLDDFRVEARRLPPALPPPDPELVQAVIDTLDLAGHGPPPSAQIAFDALVGAGEPIVGLLADRADRIDPLPGVPLRLPDGGWVAPRYEGQLVQFLLAAITTERFGDPDADDLSAQDVQEMGWAWKSWLGRL